VGAIGVALTIGCDEPAGTGTPATAAASASGASAKPAVRYDRIARRDFNRLAAQSYLPLFWRADADNDGRIGPTELAVLWGLEPTSSRDWVADGAFTQRFVDAYEKLATLGAKPASTPVAATAAGTTAAPTAATAAGTSAQARSSASAAPSSTAAPSTSGSTAAPSAPAVGSPEREARRRELVLRELDQARPTVIYTSFAGASAEDRKLVGHLLTAAQTVEQIYLAQRGALALAAEIPTDDAASRMLFYRNQGPWCAAPRTEGEPDCSALPTFPKNVSGLYPASLQNDPQFCTTIGKQPDGEKLLHQFFVVREKDGKRVPVPYREEYRDSMAKVSVELRAAADTLSSDKETPFKTYLAAAAQAFLDDSWEQADEAWAKMNAQNSRFYLRIGPDEVYFEPCSRKAGFHVSFALINQGSLAWQRKLEPVKAQLEGEVARLAGAPYQARDVSFHLPDFIDIVLNAGDSRDPFGATIGQSLPNWGPVANEGRGRTVAMTNLYSDPDSEKALTELASSMLCAPSMARFSTKPDAFLMSTVLHEAAHNLGPAHEYKVNGKKATELFGGQLASTMEELKAQSSALHLASWLAGKGVVEKELAEQAHVRDVVWAFGHISRGMYGPSGERKPYSQLAAIQLGMLLEEGAAVWQPETKAHNGKDQGCVELKLERFPTVAEKMLGAAAGLLARGDVEAAKEIVRKYVDDPKDKGELHKVIQERWQRAPVASFVYSVER
jgi:hypothetical protein